MWPFSSDSEDAEVDVAANVVVEALNETLNQTVEALLDVVPTTEGVVAEEDSGTKSLQIGSYTISLDFFDVDQVKASLAAVWLYLLGIWQQAWQALVSLLQRVWQSIDLKEIRDKLHQWIQWLMERAWLAYDVWVHHSSTQRIHEKTGFSPQTIVMTLGSVSFITLCVLGNMLRRRFATKRTGRERTQSLTWASSADSISMRGPRDRGFSLDLDNLTDRSTATTRNRIISFDFWNRKTQPKPPQKRRRSNSGSAQRDNNPRDRSGSFDLFSNPDPFFGGAIGDNPAMQHGIATGESGILARPKNIPSVAYHGPTESKLLYSTWTPPPTWTEASRSLLPHDTRMKLQREIAMDLAKDDCLMSIREPSSQQPPLTLPVAQCSLHVKPPVIGGVLQIYVKDSSKEEWLEHTFDTARNAAQFQIDMLAIQLFGPALHRMYQTLEIIHQGSMACEGREYVCHHDEMYDEVPQGVGIAWDDAMRSIGSNIPSLRIALERLWWHHYAMNSLKLNARKRARKQQKKGKLNVSSNSSVGSAPTEDAENDTAAAKDSSKEADNGANKNQNEYIHLTTEYVRKRLLLGPVDFFRLFVPCVPDTALPRNESTEKRMAQLLRWRKRAATAALLVQGYVKARIVVNLGWQLHRPLPTHYLNRRLAYDDNIDNSQRDASTKNEVYEATVSRDVLTFVRPNEPDAFKINEHWWEWRPKRLRTVISRYQAFSLVGFHVFQIPPGDFPLKPTKDPVLSFGSLRSIIEANPDLEFFVMAMFPEMLHVAYVSIFVRSLPKGVDPAFDRNFSRFIHGKEEVRDRKLSTMFQLGSQENRTWSETTATKLMTHLTRSIASDLDASTPNSDMGPSDRTPFPVIPMARVGRMRHFGGALQTHRALPQNYVAATSHIDHTNARFNIFSSVLVSLLERGILSKNVFDLTFVLAADQQDELPERAMCTMRPVHMSAKDIALPSAFVYGAGKRVMRRRSTWNASNFKSAWSHQISAKGTTRSDSFDGTKPRSSSPSTSSTSASERKRKRAEKMLISRKAVSVKTRDPVEMAVNELVEILEPVRVPIRRDQLPMYDFARNIPISLLEAQSSTDGTLHDKDLLSMSLLVVTTRAEIQRHYIASGCNIKKAAVRIVETAAWRGQTFPIDRRMCRIELQSGQFFQQGQDLLGQPVFYFRNMGLGPWRKDLNASVAAVLHRLEDAIRDTSRHDSNFKCTLVVLMGKPYKDLIKKHSGPDGASTGSGEDGSNDEFSVSMRSAGSGHGNDGTSQYAARVANPRVNPEESWQVHTSNKLIKQLVELVSAHYPERLHRALIVMKPSQTISLQRIFGPYSLNSYVRSAETRSKVRFLSSFFELQTYVSKEELVTIAGGDSPIDADVFGLEA